MNGTLDHFTTDARTAPDNHEPSPSTGWREAYRVLDVTPPDEPCTLPPETLEAITRTDRTKRYRRKHARGGTS